MTKKLEVWILVQKFLDVRSGIILSFLCINSAVMGWWCLKKGKNFPDGYVPFLGVVFSGATIGKITKTMKGQADE